MPRLFKRVAALTVGTLRFTALDFSFTVVRSLDREPNTAEIQIFNLSETSRASVEGEEQQRVRLEAGFEGDDGLSVIYEGDLRKASSTRDGPAIVTSVESGDGERQYRRARVNLSFGRDTSLRTVLERVGNAMGVGVGNLVEQAQTAGFEGLGNVFSEGVVMSGSAREELTGLLDGAGLEWSIQDGNLQVLGRGQALTLTAVVLRSGSGLVGSPSIDSEGLMSAQALLIPGVFPGRKVQIVSEFVNGFFRTTKASYTGDTRGNDWFVSIEGRNVNA